MTAVNLCGTYFLCFKYQALGIFSLACLSVFPHGIIKKTK